MCIHLEVYVSNHHSILGHVRQSALTDCSRFDAASGLRPQICTALLEAEPPGQLPSHAPLCDEDDHDEDPLHQSLHVLLVSLARQFHL